jgi:hypothetical protein
MKIFNFQEFLNESATLEYIFRDEDGKQILPKDFRKVQLLIDSYDYETDYSFKFIIGHSIYKVISPVNRKEIDPELPILNFAMNSTVQEMLDKGVIKKENLYNQPKDKAISVSKRKFHQTMGNQSYIPKTVFEVKDALKLEFPVIAKPAVGHSGIGITKFNTPAELKAYKDLDSFQLFSEAISIENEIRVVYFKDEVVAFMLREPRDEKSKFLQGKAKSMGSGKASSKLDFVYHICLPEEINYLPNFQFTGIDSMKELKDIIASIRKKVPLEFLTLDIAIDNKRKPWIIEINTEPGISGVMMANVYDAIFIDFYKKELDASSKKCLEEIELKLIGFTLQNDKYVLSPKFIQKYIG